MVRLLLSSLFCLSCLQLSAQMSPELIIIRRKLDQANTAVTNYRPVGGYGKIVTNEAINKLLANKVASYLSEDGDLSLYENYATLNSGDGTVSLSHNFPVTYASGLIRWVHTVTAKVNALDGFAAIVSDKKFTSEMALTYKATFFAKGGIAYDSYFQSERAIRALAPGAKTQKMVMDAQRTLIVNKLKTEMTRKSVDFEESLIRAIDQNALVQTERSDMREKFYKALEIEYMDAFTEQQIAALEETESYRALRKSWTSLAVTIPVTTKSYKVAADYLANFSDEEIYPWEASLTQTWIRENRPGRFFFSIAGTLLHNNNVLTEELSKVDIRKFVTRPDSSATETSTEEVYIGKYSNFVTPKIRGQFVAFPGDKNIGLKHRRRAALRHLQAP